MANRNQKNDIHDVILNSINEQRDASRDWTREATAKFSVNGSINRLVECAIGDLKFMEVLDGYRQKINDGYPEATLFESFIKDIAKFTGKYPEAKKEFDSLMEKLQSSHKQLAALMLYEGIATRQGKELVRKPLMRYLHTGAGFDKLSECLDTLSMCGDPAGSKIAAALTESYAHGSMGRNGFRGADLGIDQSSPAPVDGREVKKIVQEALNEQEQQASEDADALEKIMESYANRDYDEEYTLTENFHQSAPSLIGGNLNEDAYLAARLFGAQEKKEDIDINKIYEAVDSYMAEKKEAAEQKKLEEQARHRIANKVNRNGIKLGQTIDRLYEHRSVKNNAKLAATLAQYQSALRQGAYEERLYETFISNLAPYGHLNPVETELAALKKRVDSNRVDIDLTKILETMLDTTSYYLVPLIEEDVVRYMENKSPQNRVQLINCLAAFHGDPFVDEIMQIISLDQSRINSDIRESQQSVISAQDQIKFLKSQALISDIYSPVQYLKENESVFCVDGEFFMKKSGSISKLDRRMATNLNEQFIALARLVSDPRVIVESDHMEYRDGKGTYYIYEGGVKLGNEFETLPSLRNLAEMCMKYNNYDAALYGNLACLLENFNNIAKVDFAKHVELRDNPDIHLDLFRLNGQIFINTHNDAISENVFYRNVNPIQCGKIINEHMGMQVSNLFEDLMPNQQDIIAALNEADNAYQESIDKLKDAIKKLEDAKEGASEDDIKKLDDAIKETQEQLDDAEAEYKEFQNKADEITDKESDDPDKDLDADIDQSGDNKPADEVDDELMGELTKPIDGASFDPEDPMGADSDGLDLDFGSGDGDDDADPEEAFANSFLGDMDDDEEEDKPAQPAPEDDIDLGLEGETEDSINAEGDLEEPGASELADAPTDMFADDETEPEAEMNNLSTDINPDIKMISFDENIVTGEVQKSGQVVVVTPMVGPGGRKYLSNKTISFTIDDDKNVVLADGGDLTVDMYHAITDAVKADKNFEIVSEMDAPGTPDEGYPIDMAELPADGSLDDFGEDVPGGIAGDLGEPALGEPESSPMPASPASKTDPEDEIATDLDNAGLDDDIFADFLGDDSEVLAAKPEPAKIPTYVKGGTEFEFPAKDQDPSVIKESKFIKIKPEVRKPGFFANESNGQKAVNESSEEPDGGDEADSEEIPSPEDMFAAIKAYAKKTVYDYNASVDFDSDDDVMLAFADDNAPEEEDAEDPLPGIPRFTISAMDEDYSNNSITVYLLDGCVYYKYADEFAADAESFPDELEDALRQVNYGADDAADLDCVDIYNADDTLFLLYTIMSTMTGQEFEAMLDRTEDGAEGEFKPEYHIMDESAKIRKRAVKEDGVKIKTKTGLCADFDPNRSLQTQEIKYGTEQDKRDKEELERIQRDEESKLNDSSHPELPNKHKDKLSEAVADLAQHIEPGTKVKYEDTVWSVIDVDPKRKLATILRDNNTMDMAFDKLQLLTPTGITIDHVGIKEDGYTQDLDAISGQPSGHRDLNNEQTGLDYVVLIRENENLKVPVNIVFNGYRLNESAWRASAQDILKKRAQVRVINEDGILDRFPAETVKLDPAARDMYVWAVYTIKDDNEPQRKVKVSIPSWQEHIADDFALIDVLINDEPAQLPKESLKIIS